MLQSESKERSYRLREKEKNYQELENKLEKEQKNQVYTLKNKETVESTWAI